MLFRLSRAFKSSAVLLAKKKDFYKVLGVPKSSSEAEIKKAYFQLAKTLHPDVNKAADAKDKFAAVSEAYETLSDRSKRQMYDSTGMTGDEQEQASAQGFGDFGFGGFNPFAGFSQGPGGSFEDVFAEFKDFFEGGPREERRSTRGEDIILSMEIPFMDAVQGSQRTVRVERKAACGTCKGSRVKPGTNATKCSSCSGRGVIFIQKGPMSIQMTCQKCKGEGSFNPHTCTTCSGAGTTVGSSAETVNIPAGVNSGQNLRMAGKGNASSGGTPGDLLIKVVVQPHAFFKRDGYDIYTDVDLTVGQAVLGSTINVETLHGSQKLNVEPGTQSGDKKKISNYGVPHLPPNQSRRGDHFVKLNIKIPTTLTPQLRELYRQIKEEELKQGDKDGFFSKLFAK
jgi:molecular chaperone DnaJ